mmetsp:Transcript_38606/g.66720  ORF Transcript_38606/g.66720 Transcript_38606/m.66720 type:complete len:249 (+) Transcript_38606:278-1024(+)
MLPWHQVNETARVFLQQGKRRQGRPRPTGRTFSVREERCGVGAAGTGRADDPRRHMEQILRVPVAHRSVGCQSQGSLGGRKLDISRSCGRSSEGQIGRWNDVHVWCGGSAGGRVADAVLTGQLEVHRRDGARLVPAELRAWPLVHAAHLAVGFLEQASSLALKQSICHQHGVQLLLPIDQIGPVGNLLAMTLHILGRVGLLSFDDGAGLDRRVGSLQPRAKHSSTVRSQRRTVTVQIRLISIQGIFRQ